MERFSIIKTDQNKYLYSLSRRMLMYLPALFYDVILNKRKMKINQNLIDDDYYTTKFKYLEKHGFFDDKLFYRKMTREDADFKLPKTIAFETTEGCNLSCYYCTFGSFYNKTLRRSGGNANVKTAINYLNYVKNKFGDIPDNIGFYGGEPLLNFKFIENVVSHLLENYPNKKIRYDITTNGLLLRRYIDFISCNNFFVMVSLDGDEFYNRYRVDLNGKSSYNKVVENVFFIKKHFPKFYAENFGFISTLPAKHSKKDINLFFLDTFGKIPVYTPLRQDGVLSNKYKLFVEEFGVRSFVRKGMNYYNNNYVESFHQIDNADEIGISDGYIYYNGTCLPFELRHLINVNGDILPCEKIDYKYKLGTVDDVNISIDVSKIADNYNDFIDKTKGICQDCYAIKCSKCMFTLNFENGKPKCQEFIGNQDLKLEIEKYELDYNGLNNMFIYVEPYVFLSVGWKECVLYSTLDGHCEVVDNVMICNLLNSLYSSSFNYVIVDDIVLKNNEAMSVLNRLRELFMIDIVNSNKLPAIPKMDLILSKTILKDNYLSEFDQRYLLDEIRSVSVFIDNINYKDIFVDINSNDNIVRNFKYLKKIESVYLFSKNINDQIDTLERIDKIRMNVGLDNPVLYFINIKIDDIVDVSFRQSEVFFVNLIIDYPVDIRKIHRVISSFRERQQIFTFSFFIDSIEMIDLMEKLVCEFSDVKYDFEFVYRGCNSDFIKSVAMFDKRDLLNFKGKSMNINKYINSNFFGCISINSEGRIVFDNNFLESYDIESNCLYEKLIDEIYTMKGKWRYTRECVQPCSNCGYKYLCPPISDVEIAMDTYNFCC